MRKKSKFLFLILIIICDLTLLLMFKVTAKFCRTCKKKKKRLETNQINCTRNFFIYDLFALRIG